MEYCFQLYPFANIKYRQALTTLGLTELACLLQTAGITTDIRRQTMGGADFLTFETKGILSADALRVLVRHSGLLMLCEKENGLLRPLDPQRQEYLSEDLPEILKYKGKTAVPFTQLLINLAWSASDFRLSELPLTVLDPICGRGTSLFCALQRGMNAIGLDTDTGDLHEADTYFERYLKYSRLKHERKTSSLTVSGKAVPVITYSLADTKEHYTAGDKRTLTLMASDTAAAGTLLKKKQAELLVADLPYGVQHAPVNGRKPESFEGLLARCLPAWRDALLPGGAMAVSFNALTLKKDKLISLMQQAGLYPLTDPPWNDFRHPVEQAVERDLVVAAKKSW